MSSYPLVKFVDKPDVAATVRLDLNDGAAAASRRVEADFDLGAPTLEGEPDAIGQVYGFRSPRFTVQVKGTKPNAIAFISALSKELLRHTNWVMVQLTSTSSPVWFRTYATGFQSLSLEEVYGNTTTGGAASPGYPDTWHVEVELVAEAFAYGARETLSAFTFEQTIPSDLTGGRSAMTAVLPAIKGDAPTSLRLAITPAAGALGNIGGEWIVGCIAGTAAMNDPYLNIGGTDGLTADVGTSATASSAAYLEGNYRTIGISPNDAGLGSGSSMARRLFGFPALSLRGRYKVLLRCEGDTASGIKTYLFKFSNGILSPTAVPWSVGSAGGGAQSAQGWVDLGEFTFPPGVNVPPDGAGTVPTTVQAYLYAGTADNTAGTLRVDAFKFIPVYGPDVTFTSLANPLFRNVAIDALRTATFDGDYETAWVNDNVGVQISQGAPEMKGGFPIVDPAAAKNLLVVMATKLPGLSASATGYVTSRKAVATAVGSYYPRYLYIGDGT